jgi:hypothetical protein
MFPLNRAAQPERLPMPRYIFPFLALKTAPEKIRYLQHSGRWQRKQYHIEAQPISKRLKKKNIRSKDLQGKNDALSTRAQNLTP